MDATELWKLSAAAEGARGGSANEAWSPTNSSLAVASYGAGLHVWDVGTGQQTTALPHLQDVTAVTWSLDGGHLIAGLGSGELLVLDARDGTEVRREAAHGREVANLALSRDGSRLASSSHDGTVRISSSSDLAFITSIRPSHGGASAIAWAPEGRSVATGGLDAVVQVWDPTTGALQGGLADHQSVVSAVAYSPDGRLLVSASNDRTVRIWDLSATNYLHVLDGFQRPVSGLSLSPAGDYLAAIEETRISIFDLSSTALVQSIPVPMSNLTVSWSRDGRFLASSGFTGVVQVWSLA